MNTSVKGNDKDMTVKERFSERDMFGVIILKQR